MSTVARTTSDWGGFANVAASVVPALLFGARLATAVSLALFLAFYLQLENPSWAGASACTVCQPILGSSLLKGLFRMIGTTIAAFAAVVLTGLFPQNRTAFLLTMLLWVSACSFVSSLLRNFGAYAALLAGFTIIIIARTSIGAPDQVFNIAVARASEICVGIVCGTLVIGLTDLGTSPARLAALLTQLIAEIAEHLVQILTETGSLHTGNPKQLSALIARTAALDPIIGQAAGESPELLQRQRVLRAAMNGLFKALSAARNLETHLRSISPTDAKRTTRKIINVLPPAWTADRNPQLPITPPYVEDIRAVRSLLRLGPCDLSMRLTAEYAASTVVGLALATNGLTLLSDPREARDLSQPFGLLIADWLPALANALRVFLGVGVTIIFWIATAWQDGLLAVVFTAITIMAFAPMQGSNMSASGLGFGALLAAIVAAVLKFALLPNHETFLAFSLIIGISLLPLGALSTVPSLAPYFVPATLVFIPLLTPTNQIAYDTLNYFNSALNLLTGCGFGVVTLMLFPQLSPLLRSKRLADLSIRDLRLLAAGRRDWTIGQWQRRIYSRLRLMPEDVESSQQSYLIAALSVGIQIIRLRHLLRNGRIEIELSEMLAALTAGDTATLRKALCTADHAISSVSPTHPGTPSRLRARSALLAIGESVNLHCEYFESRRP